MFRQIGGLGRAASLIPSRRLQSCRRCTVSASKQHDPLRILFCGADDFSIYSLRALNELQQQKPESITSIDVLCRPDKRVGRGLKQVREVPIKNVAQELQLGLHQIDTFKGFKPPADINLVVAVSFGLLVPAPMLQAAKYGGLNVHPSLLPEYRGAAPIPRALLDRREETGVSLQTMHPTRFDHGVVLSQVRAPIKPDSRPEDLVQNLGQLGAKLLVDGIKDRLFVDPSPLIIPDVRKRDPSYAPKITPEDRRIDWKTWTSSDIGTRIASSVISGTQQPSPDASTTTCDMASVTISTNA